jgi:hypothetical protein
MIILTLTFLKIYCWFYDHCQTIQQVSWFASIERHKKKRFDEEEPVPVLEADRSRKDVEGSEGCCRIGAINKQAA